MDHNLEKRDRLLELLDRGMVMVHLDARSDGVEVPAVHAENPAMALNLSYRFNIPDFRIDHDGVFASLSFNRVPHPCQIPWTALYAMRSHVDDTMHVWAEDIPSEILQRAQEHQEFTDKSLEIGVPEEAPMGDTNDEENEAPPEGRATSVPYLRVIK